MGERGKRGWPRQRCNTGVLKYGHIVYYCRKDLSWSIDIFNKFLFSNLFPVRINRMYSVTRGKWVGE